MKTCTRCGIEKDLEEFSGSRVKSRCKPCLNEIGKSYRKTPEQKAKYRLARIKKQYGLEADEYLALLGEGRCSICLTTDPDSRWGTWNVDHSHVSGKVRGILCTKCNHALGLFRDNMANLERAIAYLEVNDGS